MIITSDILKEKVPKEMIPTRFDSATDLLTYTSAGLLLYNMKPDTWNELYPFFQQGNKFTIDSYTIDKDDITFGELVELYKDVYNNEYVIGRGFDEEKRKEVLLDEFNKVFGVKGKRIGKKLNAHYELKYSKSKNTYTLYYLEAYVLSDIEDLEKLLKQDVYQQELLDLSTLPIPRDINGIKIVDSVAFLNDSERCQLVRDSVLK